MKTEALLCVAMAAVCPAKAETLKAREILNHISGIWGWPGVSPDGVDRSCSGDPVRIWLEDEELSYRSQQLSGGKVLESRVGMPAGEGGDYILIRYSNHPQMASFGGQMIWALRMPDEDHFTWQEFPTGPVYPALERCPGKRGE